MTLMVEVSSSHFTRVSGCCWCLLKAVSPLPDTMALSVLWVLRAVTSLLISLGNWNSMVSGSFRSWRGRKASPYLVFAESNQALVSSVCRCKYVGGIWGTSHPMIQPGKLKEKMTNLKEDSNFLLEHLKLSLSVAQETKVLTLVSLLLKRLCLASPGQSSNCNCIYWLHELVQGCYFPMLSLLGCQIGSIMAPASQTYEKWHNPVPGI